MPTVLLVSPYLPPHIGGVERYVESVARELARLDWRVVIATPTRRRAGSGSLPGSTIEVRYLETFGRISNTPVGLHWQSDLSRIMEQDAIDVVNAHAPVPGLADAAERAAAAAPFVLTYHAGPMRKRQTAVNLGLRAYERFVVRGTVRRSSRLICSSTYVRDFLGSFEHSTPAEVIPPGVDVRQFAFAPYEGRRDLLFVGSLERSTRYKALDRLIAAVDLLRGEGSDVRLDVVGDGSARGEYEAQCTTLGLSDRVTFHGPADPSRLVGFYQRSAALVLPSRFDSMPTVILEAMACGTPVIASRVGGIPTVVEHGRSGLLIEPGSSEEIVAAVRRLDGDGEFAANLGAEGRRTVEGSLDSEIQGRRTAEVLEDAIASVRPRRRRRSATDPLPRPNPSQPSKLLMIAPYFPPHVGGVEQYSKHLATALATTGRWDVTVITIKPRGLRTSVADEDGLHVVRLGCWGTYSYTPFSPLWPWQLRHYIRRVDPDVVNAHTPVPLLSDVAAWASGRRLFLLTYHAATLEKDAGPFFHVVRHVYSVLETLTVRRADAVLAVSDYVGEELRARVTGRLVTMTNAVPRDALSERPAEPAPGQFLFMARLDREHRWKGLEYVLQAVAHCGDAHLAVAGDGDLRAYYERAARELELGDRVRFLGTVTGTDKERLIRTSTALIAYPSTSNDAFPTVLLEAWAARVPVIAADIGALRTLVHHGVDGWLVRPACPEALADTLREVLSQPAVASQLGEAGRSRMGNMTWDQQATRFEELVDSFRVDAPIASRRA